MVSKVDEGLRPRRMVCPNPRRNDLRDVLCMACDHGTEHDETLDCKDGCIKGRKCVPAPEGEREQTEEICYG
jgi:hypothetical protein